MKNSVGLPVTPSPNESSGNQILNNNTVVESPQELTKILEKEVQELRSLLERERQIKSELEAKQHNLGLQSKSWSPMVSPMTFTMNGFPINHMPTAPTMPSPHAFGYPNKYEERPLNLMTKNFNGFPMQMSFPHISHPTLQQSFENRAKYTSLMYSAMNMHRPQFLLNNQGEFNSQLLLSFLFKKTFRKELPIKSQLIFNQQMSESIVYLFV